MILRLEPGMIHQGPLVLVNQKYPVTSSSDAAQLVPTTGIKQASSEEENTSLEMTCMEQLGQLLTACQAGDQIGIVSGYRTADQQSNIYEQSLSEYGLEFTSRYVARPNESEHQTGLAVDVGLLGTEVDYLCPAFPSLGVCASFKKLAPEYGFVQRYKKEKESLTQIAHEPWHYRYVGVPHALLMEQYEMCLEEYHEYIKRFTYQGSHLYMNVNGSLVEMYFVEEGSGDQAVPIPSGASYTCSGNNMDGYIVTIFHQQGKLAG
ncbi:D-alanyl-D-alanine carboxypeptidase family protein [Paenibacillus tuaregi]|uniref:D-alanyl-D-alanine carboxypeptidase family protein n=1 Tax=Paenibacillus tuaregi TaxID=1816681 RepID=UPI0008383B2A|nr:D-alanyl-D-alanine carboxypeptidase family protein [Paenibacillus tuaregi]